MWQDRSYGVEIEVANVDQYDVGYYIRRCRDLNLAPIVEDADRNKWCVVDDCSIPVVYPLADGGYTLELEEAQRDKMDDDDYNDYDDPDSREGAEVISPPFQGLEGLGEIEVVLDLLKGQGGLMLNNDGDSTGLHVHVGSDDLTQPAVCRLAATYAKWERTIDKFHDASRRGSHSGWCASVEDTLHALFHKQDVEPYSETGWGRQLTQIRTPVSVHCRETRMPYITHDYRDGYVDYLGEYCRHKYLKVSTRRATGSWPNTVEFRQAMGTFNFNWVQAWVKFCLMLTEASKEYHPWVNEVKVSWDLEEGLATLRRYLLTVNDNQEEVDSILAVLKKGA